MLIEDVRLRVFHEAAVHGSFTKAAALLSLTRPAVSFQIKSLEEGVIAAAPIPKGDRMYRGLVFDIGNTLVRTVDLIESAYLDVFARHGIPAGTIALFKQFAGRPKHFLFAEALGDVPDRAGMVEECMREFEAILVARVEAIEAMEGAADCLAGLEARGWRIATASGFPRVVGQAILRRFGWRYPVVCDEDVKEHRPAPDPVLRACELIGVPAAETVVVGDTPQDVLSAKAAGACSVAVTTGKFGSAELAEFRPTHIIGSLAEFPALLEREFAGSPGPR
jgi:HAD superfamily hydrolase (TIGR01509 family)